MTLRDASENQTCTVRGIATGDAELESFLFSLGCYSGETVTVICKRKSSLIVSIKDGRYCIDSRLAEAILI